MTPPVKTRFAPSPTGLMHLGNVRTALFNALFAYQHQGIFLLRIEDTDVERSTVDHAQQIIADLRWLGLDWQEGPQVDGFNGPYYQSERNEIYAKYFAQLIQQNLAYPCFCSPQELALSRKVQRTMGQAPRYAGTCAHLKEEEIARKLAQGLQPTLRFRITPGQQIRFTDQVRGEQHFATNDLGDFIIRRTNGSPAFFFCNALDDALMAVTHVFRGEDHLTNTPRQILILQALGLPIPQYGHISIILGHDGKPLSKRNGSQSVQDLRVVGWLAEGVVNYLARLGHTYPEDCYLAWPALVEQFTVKRLGRSPAYFDEQQLKHWQHEGILNVKDEALWEWMGPAVHVLVPSEQRTAFIAATRANLTYPQDALHWAQILFTDAWTLQPEVKELITAAGATFFEQALAALEESQADYSKLITQLKQTTNHKGKALFMPLRVALTGETHGPELANLLPLLGLARARGRLHRSLRICTLPSSLD